MVTLYTDVPASLLVIGVFTGSGGLVGHFEQLYKRFFAKILAAKTRVGEQSFRNHHFHLWRFSADQRYSIEHAFTETLKCFRS